MKKIVRITLQGGVIQDVECPEGVTVVVRDYDTDGVEPASLERDEDGSEYVETVWE